MLEYSQRVPARPEMHLLLCGNTGCFSKVKWLTSGLGLWKYCSVKMEETRKSASAHLLGCRRQGRQAKWDSFQSSSMKLHQAPMVCPLFRELFRHLQALLWVQEVLLHLFFPYFQEALEVQDCLEVPWRRKRNTICQKRGQGAHTHLSSCVKQSTLEQGCV